MQTSWEERFMNMYVFQLKYSSMLQKVSTKQAKNKNPQTAEDEEESSRYDTARVKECTA